MTNDTKVWFITGAARGIGFEIAKAALANGDLVAATSRTIDGLAEKLGAVEAILTLPLDVTDAASAQSAVEKATAHFGRIDVLVNNAGYGQLGVFEEISHSTIEKQFDTNVYGTMHVTRAVLPIMRAQKSGHIFNMSSIGGALGFDIASIYCATKFAVEGFSECLALELKPFNIGVTIVEPGFFRTDFLAPTSVQFADTPISDYADYANATQTAYSGQNHAQPGDPVKLGAALVKIASLDNPPMRLLMGSDAVQYLGAGYEARVAELNDWKDVSTSTDIGA